MYLNNYKLSAFNKLIRNLYNSFYDYSKVDDELMIYKIIKKHKLKEFQSLSESESEDEDISEYLQPSLFLKRLLTQSDDCCSGVAFFVFTLLKSLNERFEIRIQIQIMNYYSIPVDKPPFYLLVLGFTDVAEFVKAVKLSLASKMLMDSRNFNFSKTFLCIILSYSEILELTSFLIENFIFSEAE